MQLYFVYNSICHHLLTLLQEVYLVVFLQRFPPRVEASFVLTKTLYFCKDFFFLWSKLFIFFNMWYFSSASFTNMFNQHLRDSLMLCPVISAHPTISCIQNKYWAFVQSRGDSCVMINQRMPLGMGEISTLILLKMNGWNEFDKLVFSSDNCSESFLKLLGASSLSLCFWIGWQVLLCCQWYWAGCCCYCF